MFFLGGREGAAARAAEVMCRAHPGLQVAGVDRPPFGFERDRSECARIDAALTAARPDILLVGLGSPKQEKWADRNSERLGIPVTMGVGITFEYTAGMVQRAPRWMQRVGLEWMFRLAMEPGRLWRRYLLNDPSFSGTCSNSGSAARGNREGARPLSNFGCSRAAGVVLGGPNGRASRRRQVVSFAAVNGS